MIFSFPSVSRNIYKQPNANSVEFDLKLNPIKNVKRISVGQIIMPKSELNLTRDRTFTYKVVSSGSTVSFTFNPDFKSLAVILPLLSTAMSVSGRTVTFSQLASGKIQISSDTAITLFPDLPVSPAATAETVWQYVDTSMVNVLGFSLGAPTPVPAGSPVGAPNLPNNMGLTYALLMLRVNGEQVGHVYEKGPNQTTTGPFFTKLALNREPGDVLIIKDVVGHHAFTSADTTIRKLKIEIYEPIVGNTLRPYDLNLRDWSFNLIVDFNYATAATTAAAAAPNPNFTDKRLSVSSTMRDAFSRVPIKNPISLSDIPDPTPEAIRSFTTELSTPSYVELGMESAPLKRVKSIAMGECLVWRTFPRGTIVWRWWTDIPTMLKIENIEWWAFTSDANLVAALTAATSQDANTVQWSIVNGRVHIQSSVKLVLFHDAPVPTGGLSMSYFENL